MARSPRSRAALVDALTRARQANGISIRRAARIADISPSTMQGWLDGRSLPTPSLLPNFLTLVTELGLADTDAERDDWASAMAFLRSGRVIEEPPYVGLRSYTPEDAELYVGRERAYDDLVRACTRGERSGAITVILLGESGAGKSSLLRAGLLGRALVPGGPLHGLSPHEAAPSALPGFAWPDEPFVLVVDQFEEARELPLDEQRAVFDALAALPAHATAVVALTADAFGFALRDDRFARHLDDHVRVSTLSDQEYRRIVAEPAALHGREVTPGLLDLVQRDLYQYGEPSAGTVLPLLSSALRRTWLAAAGSQLTTTDYLTSGGLWSSLNVAAEAVHDTLDPEQHALERRLFLSLVSVEDGHPLRRRISLDQLGADLHPVAGAFVAARLLTVDDGEVEISHDALLARWERLKGWIEEEAASLLIERRIHIASRLWDEGGRQPETLLPAEAELWRSWAAGDDAPLLSTLERSFIDESLRHAEAVAADQRRTIHRLRVRQWVAVGAFVVAVAMALSAFLFGARSERFRVQAEAATHSAQARQIALVADEVRPVTPNVAAQLSVAALSLDDSVETRSAVVQSAGSEVPTRATGPAGNTNVAASADGRTIVRADSAGEVSIWRDGGIAAAPSTRFASGGRQLFTLTLAEIDGRLLAFVGGQQTGGLWDITDEPRSLGDFGADTVVYSSTFAGHTLLFGTLEGEIRRYDLTTPTTPSELPTLSVGAGTQVQALAAADDWVLAGGATATAAVFSADGTRHADLTLPSRLLSASVSEDGSEVVGGTTNAGAIVWRVTRPPGQGPTFTQRASLELPLNVHAVLHAGTRVYAGGVFGEVREFSVEGEILRRWPARNAVVGLGVAGESLLVGTTEGVIDGWALHSPNLVMTADPATRLYDLTRGGDDVVLVGTTTGGRVFARSDDEWRPLPLRPLSDDTEFNSMYALSGDGRIVANQTSDGRLLTFERADGEFHQIDDRRYAEDMVDLRLSRTGRYLAVGLLGTAGYQLFRRADDGWHPLGTADDAWPATCAFNQDETLFAAMSKDGQGLSVYRIDGGLEHLVTHPMINDEIPSKITFSSVGTLAVGNTPGDITLYDMSDPARPSATQQLRDARSSISQLDFAADGSTLFAATEEGLVWAWARGADGRFALDLRLKTRSTSVPGVAALGDDVLMTLADGRTVAWPRHPRREGERLCERFGTPLSATEWERLVPGVAQTDGCG